MIPGHRITFRTQSWSLWNVRQLLSGRTSYERGVSLTATSIVPEPTNTFGFAHAIVESEHGPECTIYPEPCDPDEIVTRWVTADEESYVSLPDVR